MRTVLPSVALALVAAACSTAQVPGSPAAAPSTGFQVVAHELSPRFDSLEIRAAGQAAGWQTARLAPAGHGFRYEETTSIGPMFQRTVIEFDSAGAVRNVTQRGRAAGKEMRIDLQYQGDRVFGQVMTPLSDGNMVEIDRELPPGTLDDNVLQAILPALQWSPTAEWVIPIFVSGKDTVDHRTLRVTGVERLSVPAGEFSAYRAELHGGESPVVFWVSVQAPHPLVKVAVPGSPIEFVRIQ